MKYIQIMHRSKLYRHLFVVFFLLIFSQVYAQQYRDYCQESKENYTLGIKSYKSKKYEEAKKYFEKCYSIDLATLGKDDDRIYHAVMWYARCCYMLGDEQEALKFSRWCLVEPVNRENTIVTDSLSHVAAENFKAGNIKDALEVAIRYAELERKNVGECYWYANSLTTIADYYYQLNDFDNCLKYNFQALAIRKKQFGENHSDCYISLRNIADIHFNQGHFSEATKYYSDALKVYMFFFQADDNVNSIVKNMYISLLQLGTERIRKEDIDVYVCERLPLDVIYYLCNNLEMTYFRQGRYNDAELYAKKIVDLYNGADNENELSALVEYGNILNNNGKYAESMSVLDETVKKFADKFHDNAVYAASVRELSNVYHTLGDRFAAFNQGNKALELYRGLYDREKSFSSITELSWMLTMQARNCNTIGKLQDALNYVDEATNLLSDNKEIIQDYNSRIARCMIYKAKFICDSGDSQKALNVITECISAIKQDTLCTLFDYANALDVSTDILYRNGQPSDALTACDEFLSIIRQTAGTENERYLNALEKKAIIFTFVGDYANALVLQEQASLLAETLFGKASMSYVSVMNNVSICKYSLGDVDGALRISNNLCKNNELASKGNETMLFQVIFQKAVYEMSLKMIDLAIEDFNFALDVLKRIEDTIGNYTDYSDFFANKAAIYSNLALSYYAIDKKADALISVNKAKEILELNKLDTTLQYAEMAIIMSYINDGNTSNIETLDIAEKAISNRLGKNNSFYENILQALARVYIRTEKIDSIETYISELYDIAVNSIDENKFGLSNSMRNNFWNQHSSFFADDIPHIAHKYNTPTLCCLAYNAALYHKSFMLNSNNLIKNVILESKDSTLIEHYNNYLNIQQLLTTELTGKVSANYNHLRDSLQKEERFILNGFSSMNNLVIKSFNWKNVQEALGNDELAIEVLSFSNEDDVKYIGVCIDKKSISPYIIDLYDESKLDSLLDGEGFLSQDMISYIVSPLSDIIKHNKKIYLSPTRKLQFVPFENFILDSKVYRLSSTSQLCKSYNSKISDATLYGGLNYDANTFEKKIGKKGNGNLDLIYISEELPRAGAEYLPGTLNEVLKIHKIMNGYKVPVNEYTEERGTEKSFKGMSGKSSSLIHLATHGKYVKIKDLKDSKKYRNMIFLITNFDTSTIPLDELMLSHSYLVFSGGNLLFQHKDIPEGEENGILTALEISKLDLRNTDLVVLSACQSGLGNSNEEGVIGLQYGFKRAGVKSLLASLDNVDDKATEILMVQFYTNLLAGKSKFESLRKAQEAVRGFEGGRYKDPKYWAPFILIDAIE